ncbi:hypothetical protein GCM10011375_39150 [Hymenobacter qilianensis]|uniref:Uncharacterized protein n=2 Tax=Hymenobacter qilianensis TaxID=1385715 RepID=A0ACB5PX55_9BACT|nr:DUF2235 domain-containing protein [Hymenobacter qilianensis]QNP54396.1 DUF2235 domain-containing protein [Hymenobacter qilianensis]GGF80238.1 hypothetical protein GCM10011375_39150 [Hymenobacter qilianensis]
MPKRLVILCDGTWNRAENMDRRKRKPTNIMKLVRAIKPLAEDGTVQVTYYDKGVGNHWGVDRFLGGGLGLGLSDNVIEAYRFLVYNYEPGDAIFLFGFSRGAYTVRSLAGLIQHLGLLPKQEDFFVPEAYALYRQRPENGKRQEEWQREAADFKMRHTTRLINIHFIGVWDTVGALGVPLSLFSVFNRRHYRFHDHSLCPCIQHAYQALAVDEHRKTFRPTLWENVVAGQILEQRWFSGVHTNVGGGYEKDGLANITLHWLKSKAGDLGLEIDEAFLKYYKPWFGDELRTSMTWYYRLLGKHVRPIGLGAGSNEMIDDSVLKRMQHLSGYKPVNVLEALSRSTANR